MESNNIDTTLQQKSSLHSVTPLSKYLAMILFIALPFIGGYVGMQYAPVKEVLIDNVVTRESKIPEVKAEQYTWISYSRLLSWVPREEQNGAFQGSDGLGFSILLPVTEETVSDLPTVDAGSSVDGSALDFHVKTGTSTIGNVGVWIHADDMTSYENAKYTKHTNAQGLTYYQYVSDGTVENPATIAYFTSIDKAKMTLNVNVYGLSEKDVVKVLDSVKQTTKYDSGD